MKIFDKAIANYKSGKRVKATETTGESIPAHCLRRFESNRSISLSEYPYAGGDSSDEASVYEWSIGDNLSVRMTTNDNASESEFEKLYRNSMSESVCRDDTDPLDELVPLVCPRDAPVKSPLQSSTMRLDVNKDHPLGIKPNSYPRDEEKRSGPVDVDDFIETSSSEQCDSVSEPTKPQHRATLSDSALLSIKPDPRVMKLSIENLELQETDPHDEVEMSYSISTGLSSYYGSEGDSLRNLGDEDMEYNNNLQNKQESNTAINPGVKSWLMQGRIPGNNLRATGVPKNMLSPERQAELANLEADSQNSRTPPRSKRTSTGQYSRTPPRSNKARLSPQKKAKMKKSIKRQVISTIQTLLRPNTQEIDCKKKDSSKAKQGPQAKQGLQRAQLKKHISCISMIPLTGDIECAPCNPTEIYNLPTPNKRDLKKELSHFSTTPLAGDSVIEFPNNPKLQNIKEVLLEKEREQILACSRQRRREKKQELDHQRHLREEEFKRHQQFSSADGEQQMIPTSDMMKVVENNRNRQNLQNWVMGCSNLRMEDYTEGESTMSSALPWLCDSGKVCDSRKLTRGLSINTRASTAMVDNTLSNPNNITRFKEEERKVEPSFSDELSSASTPVAAEPSQNKTLCVVCEKNKRTYLALPCMHFSYCEHCVVGLKKNNVKVCIVCNEKVNEFSKLLY